MASAPIDYAALADQARKAAPAIDYAALADQARKEVPVEDTRSLLQKAKDKFSAVQASFDANTKTSSSEPLAETGIKSVVGAVGTPFVHPVDTAASMAKAAVNPIQAGHDFGNAVHEDYKNGGAAYAATKLAGNVFGSAALGEGVKAVPVIGDAAKAAPAQVAKAVGEASQDAGIAILNRTVGALKNDFKRGANPGRGYLETGNGPALTMQALAENAGVAKQAVGKALGEAYSRAGDDGVKIPVDVVAKEMARPIQKAIELATGPGGTGDTASIRSYIDQFEPTFTKAVENGGFTPSELFEMKQRIAQNTNWSDPAQFSLKTVRQQQTGALSGILSDAVPETADLNRHYQDLTKMAARANDRASNVSRPLTATAAKIAGTVAGGNAGSHFGPLGSLGGAALGYAADSIPLKTTAAKILFSGGKILANTGDRLSASSSVDPVVRVVAGEEEVPNTTQQKDNADGSDDSKQQRNSPRLTDGTSGGSATWVNSGISKLNDHIAADPSSGVTKEQITELAKTPSGKSLLMRASSLIPGSPMMNSLIKRVKALQEQ